MTDWQEWASCKDAEEDPTPTEVRDAIHFIDTYCSACPSATDCKITASDGDLYWSVRGGLMPERFKGTLRVPKKAKVRKAFEYPEGSLTPKNPYGKNMLERGICNKGVHVIASEYDIHNRECRQCNTAKTLERDKTRSRTKRATLTHCRHGHEKIEANGRLLVGLGRDGTQSQWFCNLCPRGNRVAGVFKPDAKCVNGHEMKGDNVVMYKNGAKLRRRCRACKNSQSRKTGRKLRAKIAA